MSETMIKGFLSIAIKRLIQIVSFVFICLNSSFAQNQFNSWRFGANAGISFNGGVPVSVPGSIMNTNEGCASVADKNGALLFYTDGMKVWNKNNIQMPNGSGLNGNGSTTQTLIVKQPGSCTLYYIFTIPSNACINDTTDGLRYSVVDMGLAGGLGDVAVKNVFLRAHVTEKVTATLHGDSCSVWILAHEVNNRIFVAYNLTESGLVMAPVTSNVGIIHEEGMLGFGSIGQMKISPDGKKIALATYFNNAPATINFCEILDFDNLTGLVSNPITLAEARYASAYGVEFSPDASRLYISGSETKKIYQFNMLAGGSSAIIASSTLIDSAKSAQTGALQLAPDGKIYLAKYDSTHLGVINNPNVLGTGCGYVDNGFTLTSGRSKFGLPSPIINTYDCSRPQIQNIAIACEMESVPFVILDTSGTMVNNVKWIFGDPGSGSADTSLVQAPFHQYVSGGAHTVTAVVNYRCKSDTVLSVININPLPTLSITDSLSICRGASGFITASSNGTNYSWSPSTGLSATTGSVIIANPTLNTVYTISVSSAQGCARIDSARVFVRSFPVGILTSTLSYCSGSTGILSAGGGGTYSWSPATGISSLTTPNIIVSNTTNQVYTVSVTSIYGCVKVDSASVTIMQLPLVAITGGDSICPGYVLSLTASGANTYSWLPTGGASSVTNAVVNVPVGNYTVVGTGANGCTASAMHNVYSFALVSVSASNDVTIVLGSNAVLSASGSGSYRWTPSAGLSCVTCQSVIATPTATTKYHVTTTDNNGCTSMDSVTVYVEKICGDIFVPNVFSPNGDGNNDVFNVYGDCIRKLEIKIYDRWGKLIFVNSDPLDVGWDGTFNGKDLDANVFCYSLFIETENGESLVKSGNITLLR